MFRASYPEGVKERHVNDLEIALEFHAMHNSAREDVKQHERRVAHAGAKVERKAIPSAED